MNSTSITVMLQHVSPPRCHPYEYKVKFRENARVSKIRPIALYE